MNVLLVDSDRRHRTNLSSRLRMQYDDVEMASGGFHAIHILDKVKNPVESYDIILLVGDAEDMSGSEIAGHIKAMPKKSPSIVYIHRNDISSKEKKYIKKAGVDEIFLLTEKNFNNLLKVIDKFG
ncbi:MAG: response regulator [Halobacteriovoraceae bacterium]|nr:response regulator [Halobacteriovoraceae bacterium]